MCRPQATLLHVVLPQGHPFARNHLRTSRFPRPVAVTHAHSSHGHPLACNHFSTSRSLLRGHGHIPTHPRDTRLPATTSALQYFSKSSCSSTVRLTIPREAFAAGPHENRHVSSICSHGASPTISRTPHIREPLKNPYWPAFGGH